MGVGATGVRLGRVRLPSVEIPGELLAEYQESLGPLPVLIWINLRWLAEINAAGDIEKLLIERLRIDFRQLAEAMQSLCEASLLELAPTGEYVLHEPPPGPAAVVVSSRPQAVAAAPSYAAAGSAPAADEAPAVSPATDGAGASAAAAPGAGAAMAASMPGSPPASIPPAPSPAPSPVPSPAPSAPPPASPPPVAPASPAAPGAPVSTYLPNGSMRLSPDMQAVMQIYEKKIGVFGPSHFDKLRFWVEEQGMAGEVVAAAIEDAARQPHTRRLVYIEGILRNWYSEGILTLRDLLEKNASRTLLKEKAEARRASMEGMPNADAYKRVDPEKVMQWKELYPDEYSS